MGLLVLLQAYVLPWMIPDIWLWIAPVWGP
jgi:hypothetical protein